MMNKNTLLNRREWLGMDGFDATANGLQREVEQLVKVQAEIARVLSTYSILNAHFQANPQLARSLRDITNSLEFKVQSHNATIAFIADRITRKEKATC